MALSKYFRILIIATSPKTRGGITAVVKAHQQGEQWNKFHCKWIETHIDKNAIYKLWYFFKALLTYLLYIPFYDLVHIHMSEPPSAIRKIPFMVLSKLFGKKTIIHFHSFSPDTTINSKYRKFYAYLFHKADCVLVLSEYWKNAINMVFKLEGKTRILYNPCDEPDYTHRYKQQKQILYAGTVNARKGYQDLEKAFAKIAADYREWNIIFAGNGEIENGKALARDLNISNQTVFLGWIDGDRKSQAFQEATIFCLPSYAEGFPMAVLDAWAYGLPVVTTPVGGLPDVLKNEENALVFQPGDTDHLSIQLKHLIDNENMRTRIASESLKLATTVFSRSSVNADLEEIYRELLTSN